MLTRTATPSEAFAWARMHWANSRSTGPAAQNPMQTVSNTDVRGLEPVELAADHPDLHARARELHHPGAPPVVVRGAASTWTATKTWTLDSFAADYGDHVVPIDERNPNGSTGTASLRECIARTRAGQGGYARFSPLMLEHPELANDLDLDALTAMSGAPLKRTLFQMFIGGAGTSTETHCAIGNNAFVQVHGEKVWHFVPPQFTAALRPMPLGRPYFASMATLHDPTLHSHPNAPVYSVHLQPGDVLLVPPFWWHQVDNPTESIGVATRWHHLRQATSQSAFLTLMTVTATKPNVVKANRDRRRFGFVYQDTVDQARQLAGVG